MTLTRIKIGPRLKFMTVDLGTRVAVSVSRTTVASQGFRWALTETSRGRDHNLMSSICCAVLHSTAVFDASGYSSTLGRNRGACSVGNSKCSERDQNRHASGRSRVNLAETDNIAPLSI